MTAVFPAFSVTLNQRRWACVLDLPLVLSEYGLPIVKQMGELLDLWVVRELWHILDNTQFFLQQPQQLEFASIAEWQTSEWETDQKKFEQVPLFPPFSPQTARALKEWDRLRMGTDPGKMHLRWVADSPMESFIPEDTDTDIIWRWEALARSLEHQDGGNSLTPSLSSCLKDAFRDAIALSATLGSAPILTFRSPKDIQHNLPPGICSALDNWGIPCKQIATTDPIAAIEADHFRQLLVHAGFSKFFWTGLQLAVLHLVVPAAATLGPSWPEAFSLPDLEEFSASPDPDVSLWEGARGFWYVL